MTVIIRKVRTALQREYKKAGGILISDAVKGADRNLVLLSARCLEQIDLMLDQISGLTADPAKRLTVGELGQVHVAVNAMLSCCASVELDGFADTLHAVGRLVGALMATDVWLAGALTPAANLLHLVRRGAVAPANIAILIVGLDQCSARARSHLRVATYQ